MDVFTETLFGEAKSVVPKEFDWFAGLIGDWDFDYYDGDGKRRRHVEGEWLFRRILNGAGIEDLFICPSRKTRTINPQPDGEYGLAVRMFNAKEGCYDMVYACETYTCHLKFVQEGDELVGTVLDHPENKWVFSKIEKDRFHWQNITVTEDGTRIINSDIYARRRTENV